jgi:hypothetical protein
MNKFICLGREFHFDQYTIYCIFLGLPWFSLLIFLYTNFGTVWFFYMILLLFVLIDIMGMITRIQLGLWWILKVSTVIIFAPIISIYSIGIQQKIEYIFYIFMISIVNLVCMRWASDFYFKNLRVVPNKKIIKKRISDPDSDSDIQIGIMPRQFIQPINNDLEENKGDV